MNNRQYKIICITIVIFIAVMLFILLKNNKNNNLIEEILNYEDYEIKMKNCNNMEKILPKITLQEISNNWNKLSNNGPWMGDNNFCYSKITITYEKNNMIGELEIQLIDNTSLVLTYNNSSTYYTNSSSINQILNEQYNK